MWLFGLRVVVWGLWFVGWGLHTSNNDVLSVIVPPACSVANRCNRNDDGTPFARRELGFRVSGFGFRVSGFGFRSRETETETVEGSNGQM